jgi:hypothetical protein
MRFKPAERASAVARFTGWEHALIVKSQGVTFVTPFLVVLTGWTTLGSPSVKHNLLGEETDHFATHKLLVRARH